MFMCEKCVKKDVFVWNNVFLGGKMCVYVYLGEKMCVIV